MTEKERERKIAKTGEDNAVTKESGHDKPDTPYTDELLERAMSKNRVALEILKDR